MRAAVLNPALVAIVALADRFCRSAERGVGYAEAPDPSLSWQYGWKILTERTPYAAEMQWSDFVRDSAS